MSFSPNLKQIEDTLLLKGDVRFENVVPVCQQGIQFIDQMKKVQVDLSGLMQCDSSVLALCSAWVNKARKQKKEILFKNLPDFMKDLIRVHGLDAILPQLNP